MFGADCKPEAAFIQFELYASLLPMTEDLQIAKSVRERTQAVPMTSLQKTADKLGIDFKALSFVSSAQLIGQIQSFDSCLIGSSVMAVSLIRAR
ncbi:hypothetical protein GCM10027416_04550 [Okibacterium endophyticum]